MKGRSILARVVRGTVLVAILTSVALAGASALVARFLWSASDARALEATTSAVAETLEFESREDNITLAAAAPGALEESAVSGFRVEVWQGDRLLASRPGGPALGPVTAGGASGADGGAGPEGFARPGWRLRVRPLRENLTLLVALPEEAGRRAGRIFALSLLLTVPLCALLAVEVGRRVGLNATRPLLEFTEKIARMHDLRRLEPTSRPGVPAEVRDLEVSFGDLMDRLLGALAREREFAANASHELRTPLTAIRLRAERALGDAGPRGREEITSLVAEIDRLVRLVDSLLVLARGVEAGVVRGEVVNLADLARDAAQRNFAGGRPARASLPDEAMVRGDEALLGIAVENLLDNARKFTSGDGVSVVILSEEQGRVRLDVTSPGAVIGAEERERIFDRFYRAPEARASQAGHGLGLPLARHIARLHGGDLSCTSGAGEDARFVLDLPAWRPEPDPPLDSSPPPPRPSLAGLA